jgi:hypothetical protein
MEQPGRDLPVDKSQSRALERRIFETPAFSESVDRFISRVGEKQAEPLLSDLWRLLSRLDLARAHPALTASKGGTHFSLEFAPGWKIEFDRFTSRDGHGTPLWSELVLGSIDRC